jgi:membrane protease YdiL (CAAX protease family)
MKSRTLFLNEAGHLRSGWRLAFFVVAFLVCAKLFEAISLIVIALGFQQPAQETLSGNLGFVLGAGVLFSSATLVGWGCGAVFEELPFRALGWSLHPGWLRNVVIGSALGAGSLFLAAALAAATRGLSWSLDPLRATSIGKTLVGSAVVFVFAASAEEVLFRGYPLQTLTRANFGWLGVLLTSLGFASVHLQNPNAVSGLTFLNTTLAGVLLAIGYLRTGSLWFPLGWHWSWNWTQGAVVGLPVSGIEHLAPAPLLHAINAGPDWLTGGAYGIEGGAACTMALLISTLVVWRTKLISQVDVTTERARGGSPET